MIIDVENHATTGDLLLKGSSESGSVCEHYWDTHGNISTRIFEEASGTHRRLQFMDEAGIDMAMLTSMHIGTLEQCKKWNDFCAKVVKENPKRFVGLACIPPLAGAPAFEELERAVKECGLKGVHIFTQTEGHPIDSREMWPFYEKVSELKIPIDVHVTLAPSGFDAVHAPYALYFVMARELDMCAATLRVCLGGVLEDFPDLVFIMNHFGGGVSAVLERLDVYMGYMGPSWPSFYLGKTLTRKPWREYFNKLYFNMAGREVGMDAVKCALTNISPKKLMLGTDWPFNYQSSRGAKRYIEEIRKLDLPKEDIEAMLGGNAARLLGI
ncbi:amidohydrolase family protein [Chloroflexota bacterium]